MLKFKDDKQSYYRHCARYAVGFNESVEIR